jgi:hypothetical protein
MNVSVQRQRTTAKQAVGILGAVTWAPSPAYLLFAEHARSSQAQVTGSSTTGVGARWWIVPEKAGLDLTYSPRALGPGVWSMGIGWYNQKL